MRLGRGVQSPESLTGKSAACKKGRRRRTLPAELRRTLLGGMTRLVITEGRCTGRTYQPSGSSDVGCIGKQLPNATSCPPRESL